MRRARLRELFVTILLVTGCATQTGKFSRTSTITRPPKPSTAVEILRSSSPQRPTDEIGVIHAEGLSYDLALSKLRDIAAQNGCDAVAGFAEGTRRQGHHGAVTIFEINASCVVYR